MKSRELLLRSLNYTEPGMIVFDMGSSPTTRIHVRALEKLRKYYGLEDRPVRLIEPDQMLGLVEEDLINDIDIDVTGAWGPQTMFGYSNLPPLKLFKTFWGQEVLVPEAFSLKKDEDGNLLGFPEGESYETPSAKMPVKGHYFDAIERQGPIDDNRLNIEDNPEEFKPVSDKVLKYWKTETFRARNTGKGVMASFGGTALGDIALVPGIQMRNPKGIRSVAEWYMSTILRIGHGSVTLEGKVWKGS
jgi:hypothetical protein